MKYKKIIFIISLVTFFSFLFSANVPDTKAKTVAELETLIQQLQQQVTQLQQELAKVQNSKFEDCHKNQSLWDWHYCSSKCKCDAGEGDCDSDSQCNTGYCALDVGAKYGQVSTMDVCEMKGCPDINADGVVDVLDGIIVGQSMDTCSGDSNYESKADVTGDGCVNQNDLSLVENSFNQSTECAQLKNCPDINYDGTIDVGDMVLIGQSWFLCKGQSGYNPEADVTGDECVDNGDMIAASKYLNYSTNNISLCETSSTFSCDQDFSCSQVISSYLSILTTYDNDSDGKIDVGELAEASNHFLYSTSTNSITKDQVCAIKDAYEKSCSFGALGICTDSDGGKDYYVKGFTTDGFMTRTDSCYDSIAGAVSSCSGNNCALQEFFCGTDSSVYVDLNYTACPNGCQEGKCVPDITITSPNGGEDWTVGETYDITWDSKGVDKVNIELVKGNEGWHLAYDVSAAAGKYAWQVGDFTPDSTYKIHIWDAETPIDAEDYSDNYFSIMASGTCDDSDGGINYYTKGNCAKCNQTGELNVCGITPDICSGSTLLEYYCGNNECKETLYDCHYGCMAGACNKGITVISPNGGEQWVKGGTYEIKWESEGVENVYIDVVSYELPSIARTIVSSIPASIGSFSWKIGDKWPDIATGDKYKIRVYAFPFNTTVYDRSDGYFSIVTGIACTDSDSGKDYYTKGFCTDKTQTYSDGCLLNVVNEYYCDSISNSCKNEVFTCPNGCKDGACLKTCEDLWWYDSEHQYCQQGQFCGLYMYSGLETFNTQAECETSLPPQQKSITITSPNGGERWEINLQQKISWTYTTDIYNQVDILLGGYDQLGNLIDDWKLIKAGVSTSQKTYYWVPSESPLYLPSSFSREPAKYKIKIREGYDIGTPFSDTSDDYFLITKEDCHTVLLWDWNYCKPGCKCDAGEGDCDTNDDCNTGYCAQNVGTKYGQVSTMDVCETKEEKSITVISPNGGEQWEVGKAYDIKWDSTGIEKVNIILSDNRTDLRDIVQAVASPGKYSWTIPQDIKLGSNFRILIFDKATEEGPLQVDESDSPFSIVAGTTYLKIANVTGIKNTYSPGEQISLSIKGIESDGTPASVAEGYNIQAYIFDSARTKTYAGVNGSYDNSTGLWKVNLTAPTDSSLDYDLMISLYCAGGGVCTTKVVGNGQVDNFYRFNLSSLICTDSDGGKDYYVKGWVQDYYDTEPFYDYCTLDGKEVYSCTDKSQNCGIIEKYCDINNRRSGQYLWGDDFDVQCPYGCQDGACLTKDTYKCGIDNTEKKCCCYIPSHTYNLSAKTFVGSVESTYRVGWSNSCRTNVDFQVLKNGSWSTVHTAPGEGHITKTTSFTVNDTIEGVRVKDAKAYGQYCYVDYSTLKLDFNATSTPTCTDSDGGKDYYTKGTITKCGTGGECEIATDRCDQCTGGTPGSVECFAVKEYYCESNEIKSDIYTCPSGCSDGACLKEERSITVISPNGGETWEIGKTYGIKWESAGVENVYVNLLECGTNPPTSVVSSTFFPSEIGGYSWIVPSNISPGDKYRIWIGEKPYEPGIPPYIYDTSDNYFSIVIAATTPGALDVTLDSSTPMSTNVTPGQTNVTFARIKLSASASGDVNNMNKIQIGSDSADASNYLTNIKIFDGNTQLGTTATYLTYNGSYYYKWVDVSGVSIPAASSKILTIVADVKSTASGGSVRLGIAGLNFDSPGAIVSGTPRYGFNMTVVPLTTPSITVISPNGGEQWEIGKTYDITWKASGVEEVQIAVMKGEVAYELIPSIPASAGKYSWTVGATHPYIISGGDSYRIRILTLPAPSGVWKEGIDYDKSDNYFSIIEATKDTYTCGPDNTEQKCCCYVPSHTYNLSAKTFVGSVESTYRVGWSNTCRTNVNFQVLKNGTWSTVHTAPGEGHITKTASFAVNDTIEGIRVSDAKAYGQYCYVDYSKLKLNFTSTSTAMGLKTMENQLASILEAVSQLLVKMQVLIKQ